MLPSLLVLARVTVLGIVLVLVLLRVIKHHLLVHELLVHSHAVQYILPALLEKLHILIFHGQQSSLEIILAEPNILCMLLKDGIHAWKGRLLQRF